jgi:hypothetical protein
MFVVLAYPDTWGNGRPSKTLRKNIHSALPGSLARPGSTAIA